MATRKLMSRKGVVLGMITYPDHWDNILRDRASASRARRFGGDLGSWDVVEEEEYWAAANAFTAAMQRWQADPKNRTLREKVREFRRRFQIASERYYDANPHLPRPE